MKVRLIFLVLLCLGNISALTSQSLRDSLRERLKENVSEIEIREINEQLFKLYYNSDQFKLAEFYALEAAAYFQNDTLKTDYARVLLALSAINFNQNSFGKAYQYSMRAATIADLIDDRKLKASALNNAAIILKDDNRFDRAKQNAKEALAIFNQLHDSTNIAIVYNTIGTIYKGQDLHDSALLYFQKSLHLKNKFGSITDQLTSHGNIANHYTDLGYYDSAFAVYSYLISNFKALDRTQLLGKTFINLADLNFKQGNLAASYQYADSALQLATKNSFPDIRRNAYEKLSEAAAEIGDFETAWHFNKMFKQLDDSLAKADNTRLLNESELIYLIRKDELKVAQLSLKKARTTIIFHITGSIVLLVVTLLLVFRSARLRRAKEAIRASERKFKMMAEKAPDVIWASDLNLNLTYISPATEQLFGYPRNERLKMPMKSLFDESSIVKIETALKVSLSDFKNNPMQVKPLVLELQGWHKSGSDVWVEVTADFTMDEKGKITGLQGIARNITERKKTQLEMMRILEDLQLHDEELKVQNEELIQAHLQTEKAVVQYFDLFENSPAGYIILNNNGQVEEINNTAATLIGHDKKMIIGQNLISWFDGEHKSEFARMLVRTLNKLSPNQQEFQLGKTHVKILSVPDSSSGRLKCRLALVDISNEVAAREKLSLALLSLQTVFDAIPGGIAVINNDYHIININNRLLQLHNLSNKEAALGKTCFDVFNCGSQPCIDCPLTEVRQTGTTLVRTIQHNDRRFPDGAYQVYYSPIYDTNGTFNGMVEVVMDISDLKKAEDALAASEQKFEELFNDIPDAVFITKVGENSGNIIDVNPAAEKQTGYSRDELLRMNVLSDISMLKADEHITTEREINLLNREKIELTEQKRRKDGSLIWTEVVVQRIEINGVYCALSVSRDITERKVIEENLKNSRNRTISILNAIPDMLFVLNKDGYYLEFHANETKKLFLPPEAFINKRVDKIMPEYLAELTLDRIKTTIETGISQVYNYELLIDGETQYFEARMVKNSDNTVLSIVRDITETIIAGHEKRKNEEKYKAIFINSPIGVLNFDKQSIIHDCNNILVQIIGSSREALIGFNMLERMQNQGVKQAIKSAIEIGSGFYEGNYTSVTANKTTPVKAYFKCIFDENGDFVDGIGLIEDITEQKKYEQELVEARKLAEQSDRLKSSFMATMSHELRTPLNTVIGFADMIDGNLPADQAIEFAHVISRSGKHLLNIIEDILDISLIDSGEVKLSHERLSLGDYADTLFMIAQQEKMVAGKNHLSVQLSILANMRDLRIIGDTHKLNKIFAQIIKNAFKFTRQGSVEIGIGKRSESDSSQNVIFYVKDSGIGISKEMQSIIFDVFRQVDDSSTREFEGTGLGLAISKKLVQLMGGTIWVESEPGTGSIFYVKLPCLVTNGSSNETYQHQEPSEIGLSSKSAALVLIAEDDDMNFHLYEMLLRRRKINVVRAKNGIEAIRKVKDEAAIKLVLMDINMPEMGGIEAVTQIKSFKPDLPIIALTALNMPSDKETAFMAGCDDFIPKPINNNLFMQAVIKFL